MSTFGDYKSYKKYEPAYAEWKQKRDVAEAKRLANIKQNQMRFLKRIFKEDKRLLEPLI